MLSTLMLVALTSPAMTAFQDEGLSKKFTDALNGVAFERVNDDTRFRLGLRYGTRHHLDSASISIVSFRQACLNHPG